MRRLLLGMLGVLFTAALACAEPPVAMKVPIPELQDVSEWINTRPLAWKDLRGQVVVVHFWTFGCINCIHNQPHYKAWHEKYSGKGVTLIGFHTPETKEEYDLDKVRQKVKDAGLAYPIAVDNDGKNWKAWDNRWWPCTYLIDKKGNVRYRWDGELNWKESKGEEKMRAKIEELLSEKD
jgi:thiol-disulfide isomerase/thioredoxin